jgi:hypothetical protein
MSRTWDKLVLARRRLEKERVSSLTQLHEDTVAVVKEMYAKELAFTKNACVTPRQYSDVD